MELIANPPCWYWPLAFAWAAYQGARGARELRLSTVAGKTWAPFDRYFVLYIHDSVFRGVCTLAGFVALRVCYQTAQGVTVAAVTPGQVALLAASFLLAVLGIGGQLHYAIILGKVPKGTSDVGGS